MEKQIKKILLLIIAGVLFIPLIQFQSKVVFVKPLHGSFFKYPKPHFHITNWFNVDFQSKYDSYFNQNFGFRSSMVRLHNQVEYSLYGKVNANSVVVGKDNYLYERQYIKSYLGDDFLGRDSIHKMTHKLMAIQDSLSAHHTKMLLVITPGKGWFYPEHIPDSMMHPRSTTNYEVYLDELKKSRIPYIDFNALFLQMKDTASIIIYPQTGIHWSQGIVPYVTDSIIKKAEKVLGYNLNHIHWNRDAYVGRADKVDADIEKGLNLIFPLKTPSMNYPEVSFDTNKNIKKPKAIAISDSFWWQIFNMGVSTKVFNHASFWYYYKQVYPNSFKDHAVMVDDIQPKNEIFNTDLVILMTTEANLYKFPYGFQNIFNPKPIDDSLFQHRVQSTMDYIRKQKKWMAKIEKKAKKRGVSVDSMLYLDARFMVKKKMEKEKN